MYYFERGAIDGEVEVARLTAGKMNCEAPLKWGRKQNTSY